MDDKTPIWSDPKSWLLGQKDQILGILDQILGLPHYPSLLGHIFWSTLSKGAQNIESITGSPVKRY
jgi:hypothetical protein